MNLRKEAKGQPCICCGHDDGTTVLHHIRAGGNGGMGKKPPDWHGIEVCASCHDFCHSGLRGDDWKLVLIAYQRQIDRWLADGRLMFTDA